VAERFKSIVRTTGARTILNVHYTGTISLLAFLFPLRFFKRLGATEVAPDTICNMAGQVALSYVYGTGLSGFDPRTARDAANLIIWGANPSVSAPHTQEHWVAKECRRVIVVDPIRTKTAAAADLHLQPFPGSDAALAFALLHVLRRDGLVDRDFIRNHTLGWEELEPLLDGCTPSWGEATTGVPARLIDKAATHYAAGPSLLWLGQGLQRQATGGNIVRACAMLPAVTGNIGKPGAGILYLNWDLNLPERYLDDAYLTAAHLAANANPRISHMDLATYLEDAARAQALVCWNMNIAASNPEQARLRRALSREDLFTVALDIFPTDTTDFADIVLPAASFLEFDDLVAGYFNIAVSAQVKAADPLGEALPNQEIFRRLSRAMGYSEPELFESDEDIIATVLQRSGLGIDFLALATSGTVDVTPDPLITFADLKFPTQSGRIEIVSLQAEADGYSRVPLPLADRRPSGGRLRLLSPASSWRLNSSFANTGKLDRREPVPTVRIHPTDVANRGLRDGDSVTVSNETGSMDMQVRASDAVLPGVAVAEKGRWPKRQRERVNVNVLNPGLKGDMGESTCVHGAEITVDATGLIEVP
jgi:anaerobic selenocysteine-containing dehydrogenase